MVFIAGDGLSRDPLVTIVTSSARSTACPEIICRNFWGVTVRHTMRRKHLLATMKLALRFPKEKDAHVGFAGRVILFFLFFPHFW